MSTINFRVGQMVEYFTAGNNSKFAKILEISEANVRNYINGTEPKFSFIEKLVKSFEINSEWLLTGQGSMLPEKKYDLVEETPTYYKNTPSIITVDSHNKDNIVLVPQKLKAGYLTGFNNPSFIEKLPSYRMPGLNNGVFRMFEIEGNSMFPTLPNRSYVVGQFVEKFDTGIKDNQLYAIISNDVEDGLVKRCINRIKKYNNLICKSDNRRSYPTQNIDPSTIKEVWEIKLHLNFQLPDPADVYERMNDLEAELEEVKRRIKK